MKVLFVLLLLSTFTSQAQTADLEKADRLFEESYYDEAKAIYLKHESKLDSERLLALGDCFRFADPPDYKNAIKYYRRSAESGSTSAMMNLFAFFSDGAYVQQDMSEAIKWLEKAAALDDAYAMVTLGEYYYAGEWLNRDLAKAVKLWLRAETFYEGIAAYQLGTYYEMIGSYKEAAKWYALDGGVDADFRAARMYDHEYKNSQAQYNEALDYYYRAIAGGLEDDSLQVASQRVKYYADKRSYAKEPPEPSGLRQNLSPVMSGLLLMFDRVKAERMLSAPPLRGGTNKIEHTLINEYFHAGYSQMFSQPYMQVSQDYNNGNTYRLCGAVISHALSADEGSGLFDKWKKTIQAAYPEYTFNSTGKSLTGKGIYSGKPVFIVLNLENIKGFYFLEILIKDSDAI